MENTDKDSDSGKRHNEGAAEEAINLQAMSLLMQEVPVPAQAGEAPDKQAAQDAAMLTEYVSGTRKDGTDPFIQHSFSRS